ncbi:hypothetical protein EVAR_19658_1 [Eumeta japonica]|uniref:Uncharacterized protein n=1 Tax=Eumeta variegata TaxID=151549 RepID=A0A4C1V3F1_EUMVA|nr:hypothetical protein EVAR_19658_1 [Eumeta japonica]
MRYSVKVYEGRCGNVPSLGLVNARAQEVKRFMARAADLQPSVLIDGFTNSTDVLNYLYGLIILWFIRDDDDSRFISEMRLISYCHQRRDERKEADSGNEFTPARDAPRARLEAAQLARENAALRETVLALHSELFGARQLSMKRLNSHGEATHPCLTPLRTTNQSPRAPV